MKTKTHLPVPGVTDSAATPFAWDALTSAGRQQAAAATEYATIMFRGFEAMRKVQEQAAHTAALRHAAVAKTLQTGSQTADLFALNAQLLRFDWEACAKYWQQLTAAALEMQTSMLASCSHLVESDATLQAMAAADSLTGRPPARHH